MSQHARPPHRITRGALTPSCQTQRDRLDCRALGDHAAMNFRTCLAASLCLFAAIAITPSPARADRCDDLAGQLKNQIDGLHVGKTAANAIYLSHPAARQLMLGCPNRKFTFELIAGSDSRKPKPAFVDLVARASAIIFTIPKADTLKGVNRCIKRMGILHGNDVRTRYRRLNMHCTRTKTSAAISVSRGNDE
jgi:hypothetical protein